MEKIISTVQLIEAIRLLEIKQKEEELLLKEQFIITYESLKPVSLIKSTIKDLMTTPNLNNNILCTVLSIASDYATKKIAIADNKTQFNNYLSRSLKWVLQALFKIKQKI